MLNELLIVERGARAAGVEIAERHPDIKTARRVPTLLVRLSPDGKAAKVLPVPPQVTCWTLREGQQNSFPFLQQTRYVKKKPEYRPLLLIQNPAERILTRRLRDADILRLAQDALLNSTAYGDWPGEGVLNSVKGRLAQLVPSDDGNVCALAPVAERFLRACDSSRGGSPSSLLRDIADQLLRELKIAGSDEWATVAAALLVEGSGAFLFDADGPSAFPIYDPRHAAAASAAMRRNEAGALASVGTGAGDGRCGLTGQVATLVAESFPQPNLPLLGQTFLFSRNGGLGAAPALDRYGRFGARSMPVARDVAIRLSAALTALTDPSREGVTWRGIPAEAGKRSGLLLAFVESAPDAPVVEMLVDDQEAGEEDEPSKEVAATRGNSVATFEQRTERLIDAIRAKSSAIDRTQVRYAVFRQIDPANRKVSYQGQIAVSELARAAEDWALAEHNVPRLSFVILRKDGAVPASPPHVAPLGLIGFSRQLYIRGGLERQDITGFPAGEALGLFLDKDDRRVARFLRLVLGRRTCLVAGMAHATHLGPIAAKAYDTSEALRTVTVLGIVLHKMGRRKDTTEDYMNDSAFKFGQLLAAADVVHAGYCADVRGGSVPPSLLGNQVFGMAQVNPTKALDALGRRWKPYEGWAAKAVRAIDKRSDRRRDELMRDSKNRGESQRGWDISRALSVVRRVRPLIQELRPVVDKTPNDGFRAELLLGYIAGLPKMPDGSQVGEGKGE